MPFPSAQPMAETQKPSRATTPAGAPDTGGPREDAATPGGDDVDPELLSIRGPRPRAGVLLSLSVVVLCAYLMISIWPDLRFALAGHEPETIADPAAAIAGDGERFVAIEELSLDRAAALRISHSPDPALATGHRVAPALGTGGALWVATPGHPNAAPLRHDETHIGRLRALADVPFAAALQEHARERGAPRYTTGAMLREALGRGDGRIFAPGGEPIDAGPKTPVTVAEIVANEAEITAIATDAQPSAERWAHALADAGALPRVGPPIAAGDDIWVFEAPGRADDLNAILSEHRLIGAQAEQVQRTHEADLGALQARADALVAGDVTIPWADIDGVWLEVAVPVADGAALLLAGEHPRDYRHALWLFALLAAFALVFAWALGHGLRREVSSRATPSPPEKSEPQADP